MTFADSWNSIQNSLDPGAQVKNWTAAKGYLGDVFTIVQVSPAHVVVSSPEAPAGRPRSLRSLDAAR
jgi:hypothetical protein